MSPDWSSQELDRIGAAQELSIAVRCQDSSLRRPVPIWVVRVGEDLYVRSWHGADGSWYRAATATHEARVSAGGVDRDVVLAEAVDDANGAVDVAYKAKYGRYSGYVEPMIAPPARATTLRLIPHTSETDAHQR
jgi:hypothetical protein